MQEDIALHKPIAKATERAVLVGIVLPGQNEETLQEYLDELAFLAETAGAVEVDRFYQKLDHPHPRTFLGSGKLKEIKEYVNSHNIDLVIFDDDLSGTQWTAIEKELKCKILDRSHLILDIFALRARTAQARTQVELAQMQYLLPRLRGLWTHLERQKGGIGLRGPGEKEIETDRRIVQDKISKLKAKLDKIDKQNATRRKNRGEMIRVALVGYTNVGKSTLMNRLSKSDVFAEDKLFATLDTTVRKVVIDRVPILMSDTVGFIRKLPHHLIESFKSTLDEAQEADLLLHVVDISHPQFEQQMHVVQDTLRDLGVDEKNSIVVFNKMDKYESEYFDEYLGDDVKAKLLAELKKSWIAKTNDKCVFVSAINNDNIDELRTLLFREVKALYLKRYPYRAEMF